MHQTAKARERLARLHMLNKAKLNMEEQQVIQKLLADLALRVKVVAQGLDEKTSLMLVITTIECDEEYCQLRMELAKYGVNPYMKILDDMEVEQKRVVLMAQRK